MFYFTCNHGLIVYSATQATASRGYKALKGKTEMLRGLVMCDCVCLRVNTSRVVYPYLPLATNAPRTISIFFLGGGILLKV